MTAPNLPSEPPMTQDNSSAQLVEPLTDAEAEAALVAVVETFDRLGCCPVAMIDDKEDEGVSFSLHFGVERARKLIEALTRPQPSTSSVEAVARAELLEWASQHSNVTPLDGTDRDSPTFGDLRAALAPPPAQSGDRT